MPGRSRGVESASKATSATWQVSGISRAVARVVSQVNGAPAYGGTPSDASVIHAIQDLKARGLKVMFYPFILMDVRSRAMRCLILTAERGAGGLSLARAHHLPAGTRRGRHARQNAAWPRSERVFGHGDTCAIHRCWNRR